MIEMLALPFMQRALVAGVLVGILAGYYGTFVVQRGTSFLGSGLAHAAFGGVALGLFLGQEPLWVALPFTALVSAGIIWLKERTSLAADTSIGIFFSVSMALGIIFLAKTPGYTTDAFAYLFGSLLAVRWTDIGAALGVGVLTALAAPLWGRWAVATFDRELARSERVPVLRDDYILSVLLAVTIVVSIKVVGITLVASALVIPAAAARMFCRTFSGMTLTAMVIGGVSSAGGLVGSYYLDLPTGPVVILAQAAVFCVAMLVGRGR